MVTMYTWYTAGDSTRTVFLGLGQGVAYDGWEGRGSNAPPESGYVPASDIVAFDIYPYNNCGGDSNEQVTCGQFWLNAFGVDRLHQWSNRAQGLDRHRDHDHQQGEPTGPRRRRRAPRSGWR